MAGRTSQNLLTKTNARRLDVDKCSARELIDLARHALKSESLYGLGVTLGVNPQYPQRWYRANHMTATTRQLIKSRIVASGGF